MPHSKAFLLLVFSATPWCAAASSNDCDDNVALLQVTSKVQSGQDRSEPLALEEETEHDQEDDALLADQSERSAALNTRLEDLLQAETTEKQPAVVDAGTCTMADVAPMAKATTAAALQSIITGLVGSKPQCGQCLTKCESATDAMGCAQGCVGAGDGTGLVGPPGIPGQGVPGPAGPPGLPGVLPGPPGGVGPQGPAGADPSTQSTDALKKSLSTALAADIKEAVAAELSASGVRGPLGIPGPPGNAADPGTINAVENIVRVALKTDIENELLRAPDEYPGIFGKAGPNGSTGDAGPPGPPGPPGVNWGPPGAPGAPGPLGSPGAVGPQGLDGSSVGPPGIVGPPAILLPPAPVAPPAPSILPAGYGAPGPAPASAPQADVPAGGLPLPAEVAAQTQLQKTIDAYVASKAAASR